MPELTPLLKARFAPGSSVTDEELSRFQDFLPRKADESNRKYAERLHNAGYVRLTTSEQMRDLSAFRTLSREAEVQGVPVLILTQDITEPSLAKEEPIQTLDDLYDVDRATGRVTIKKSIVDASGDAGHNRNDPYTAATEAQTKAADAGHSKQDDPGGSGWDGAERRKAQ